MSGTLDVIEIKIWSSIEKNQFIDLLMKKFLETSIYFKSLKYLSKHEFQDIKVDKSF